MPLFDHFSLIAPIYDRVIRIRDEQQLIDIAALPVSGRLLDAAGGTGRVAQVLRAFAGQVIVADVSLGMLSQAAAKPGIKPVCGYTERLPFPDESFERIIMVDALHHVANQSRTASEMWRLLARGGRLVIEEPDIETLAVKFIALGEKLAFMRSHFLSAQQMQALFPFPDAHAWVKREDYKAWVIVEKN